MKMEKHARGFRRTTNDEIGEFGGSSFWCGSAAEAGLSAALSLFTCIFRDFLVSGVVHGFGCCNCAGHLTTGDRGSTVKFNRRIASWRTLVMTEEPSMAMESVSSIRAHT